jgi:hypothetical protein
LGQPDLVISSGNQYNGRLAFQRRRVLIPEGRQAKIIFLTILLAVAIGVPNAAAAPSDPTVRVEPARLDVRPGEDFEVQVMIDDVEDLGGFELNIAYDPSVIELKDAAVGDFLGSTGAMVVPLGPQVSEEEGTLAFGAAGFSEGAGPAGSGVLVTISGAALREGGSSALRLEKVSLLTAASEALSAQTEDGEIVVQGPAAPSGTTPWTWIRAGGLLVVVAAAVVAFAVLRGRPQEESEIDSG